MSGKLWALHMGNRHAVSYDQAYTVDNAMLVCSGAVLEFPFALTSCQLPLPYAICHLLFAISLKSAALH